MFISRLLFQILSFFSPKEARMAYDTMMLNAAANPIPAPLLDKHFFRKHGPSAYYGQGVIPKERSD